MGLHWDGTITLGNILSAVMVVVAIWAAVSRSYNLIDKRATVVEQTILRHASLLETHSARMAKQDELLLSISGTMNRIVGRLEMVNPQSVAEAAAQAIKVVKNAEAAALNVVAAAAAKQQQR